MKNREMDDIENVGIMQGFLNDVEEEEDELEEEESSEEANAARMLDRRPDSPEILMNNLRGDMRSVDARRDELADLVGYEAAAETPDAVLAMLQPVLAQQGGIGALPQSGPMAQGPQPPMPPPPGAMGSPPAGAPPLPPGGAPPPPGGDMAALQSPAGAAPGGAPAPMIGPDGQPIPPEGMPPIQMYRGGEVRRFRDGSPDPDDEDEETQKTNSFYDMAALSPETLAMAQLRAKKILGQEPLRELGRRETMADILPEYEELAGADRNSMQANMLFDIAGAALNYAGNRGPGGEALRGSALSRFAGAFSGVPASMQKRIAEIEKTKQQLRVMALDASEKEIKRIQDYNSRLTGEQSTLALKVLEAKAKQEREARGAGGLGSSLPGRTLDMWAKLAPDFAAGRTTPQQERTMLLTLDDYLKSSTRVDPKSGETMIVMPPLSPVIERALAKREIRVVQDQDDPTVRRFVASDPNLMDYLLELQGGPGAEAAPPTAQVARPPITSPTPAQPVTPSAAPPVASSGAPPIAAPREQRTVLGGTAIPESIDASNVGGVPRTSLVDSLFAFGFAPGVRRALGKLPVEPAGQAFGKDVGLETNAVALTSFLRDKYTEAGRVLASERAEISNAINTIPEIIRGNPAEAYQRMAFLTSEFQRIRDDALRVAADPVELESRIQSPRLQAYNIKTRQDFLLKAQQFQDMIDAIGIQRIMPIVETEEELDRELARCVPGKPCYISVYENGAFKLLDISQPEQ